MQTVAETLAMGGYGAYVWSAFGFTLVLMIGLLWQSWRSQRHRSTELASLRNTIRGGGERAVKPLVATKPTIAKPNASPATASTTLDASDEPLSPRRSEAGT